MIRTVSRAGVVAGLLAAALGAATPAMAHPHTVDWNGDGRWTDMNGNGVWDPGEEPLLANGQNHAPFVTGTSCGGDPAAYGLESAHHGPDAGTPGKRQDGCYQTTGSVAPGADVDNPIIR